jgi:hypothetical protein
MYALALAESKFEAEFATSFYLVLNRAWNKWEMDK